ncbi:MAG: hypothetical protein U5M51_01645 [Emticicia sp.]|nr:hypothetical protein [Emticicia sp.]
MQLSDSEKLNNIERYIVDLEKSMSEILADNSRFKVKFEKLEKMGFEIAALRKDFNTLSNDFHEFKGGALTYEGFEKLIDAMLARTQEISEVRIMSRKHDSDIGRVDKKVETLSIKVETISDKVDILAKDVEILKSDVSELKSDVSELKSDVKDMKSEMREGFSLIIEELKLLKKS